MDKYEICKDKKFPLTILQGYFIPWKNVKSETYMAMLQALSFDKNFVIQDYYETTKCYEHHDSSNGNNLPNKQFAVHFAKKMNKDFLHFDKVVLGAKGGKSTSMFGAFFQVCSFLVFPAGPVMSSWGFDSHWF